MPPFFSLLSKNWSNIFSQARKDQYILFYRIIMKEWLPRKYWELYFLAESLRIYSKIWHLEEFRQPMCSRIECKWLSGFPKPILRVPGQCGCVICLHCFPWEFHTVYFDIYLPFLTSPRFFPNFLPSNFTVSPHLLPYHPLFYESSLCGLIILGHGTCPGRWLTCQVSLYWRKQPRPQEQSNTNSCLSQLCVERGFMPTSPPPW